MPKFSIVKGESEVILPVFIQDSSATDGAGLAGLDENSSIAGGYVQRNGVGVALAVDEDVDTEGTYQAPSTVAHVRIGTPANLLDGDYELHFHNDLFATADWVMISLGGAANMAVSKIEVQLTSVDFNEGVRGGMTALPDAAAEASGGIYTRGSGAGQINQSSNGSIHTDLRRIMDAILTESGAGRLSAAFIKLLDVATPLLVSSTAMLPAADVVTAMESDGSKLDEVWDTTEENAGTHRFTSAALAEGPGGGGAAVVTDSASRTASKADVSALSLETTVDAVQAVADAIQAVTDNLPNAGALDDLATILGQTGTSGVVLSAAQMNAVADHILRRTYANVEASSDGDTIVFRSLIGAVAKLVNRVAIAASTLTVYKDDDSTPLGTQTVTDDASADPITGVNTD